LSGQVESVRTPEDYIAWELFGNRAVRQGDWKLRWEVKPLGTSAWELFNIANDPAERVDLASTFPQRVESMLKLWDEYVARNNVILPSRTPFEGLEHQLPPRIPVESGFPPLVDKRQYTPPADMMASPKE
jgi:arylsulfatase